MATPFEGVTPPPPSLRTPSTPQYGFLDGYQPYSPRRFTPLAHVSNRQKGSTRKNVPSGSSLNNFRSRNSPAPLSSTKMAYRRMESPVTPKKASIKSVSTDLYSDFSGKRNFCDPNLESSIESCLSPCFSETDEDHKSFVAPSTLRSNGMLPTPAKTPVRRPSKTSSSITSVARNLFSDPSHKERTELSHRRKSRDQSSTDSSESTVAVDCSDAPAISVNTYDRIPTIDRSESNPFFNAPAPYPSKPDSSQSKPRFVTVPGEGIQLLEDLKDRDKGLVYHFRGKTIYRKFRETNHELSDDYASPSHGDTETLSHDSSLSANLCQPLTRSSVKPRLLFTSKNLINIHESISHDTEDEEAETDIEESSSCTPRRLFHDQIKTPKASREALISPTSTLRVTRSKKLDLSNLSRFPPNEANRSQSRSSSCHRDNLSPFHTWRLTKPHPQDNVRKRSAEPLSRSDGSKRIKI